MAKIVKTMTKAAWQYAGLERYELDDFSDDGNYFRMYIYKNFLEVSYCTGSGEKYLTIRSDYSNYNGTSFDFFRKNFKDAYDREWEFNGAAEIDLDKLKENLEVTYQALIAAKELWNKELAAKKQELTDKYESDLHDAIAEAEEIANNAKSFNILDADFEKIYNARKDAYVCWSLKDFKETYDILKRQLMSYKKELIELHNDTIEEGKLVKGLYKPDYCIQKINKTLEIAKELAA